MTLREIPAREARKGCVRIDNINQIYDLGHMSTSADARWARFVARLDDVRSRRETASSNDSFSTTRRPRRAEIRTSRRGGETSSSSLWKRPRSHRCRRRLDVTRSMNTRRCHAVVIARRVHLQTLHDARYRARTLRITRRTSTFVFVVNTPPYRSAASNAKSKRRDVARRS